MSKLRLKRGKPEDLQQNLGLAFLRSRGAVVFKLATTRRRGDHQGTMQTEGLPDVIAFVPVRNVHAAGPAALRVRAFLQDVIDAKWLRGREQERLKLLLPRLDAGVVGLYPLAWEVKSARGELSAEQAIFGAFAHAAGVHVVVGQYMDLLEWAVTVHVIRAEDLPVWRRPLNTTLAAAGKLGA